jgi:RNA polymerase sigma-32 factor
VSPPRARKPRTTPRAAKAPGRASPPRKKAATPAKEPEVLEPEVEEAESRGDPEELLDVAVEPAPLPVEALAAEEAEDRGTALSRSDPLARYMSEVSKYPLLTREQEHDLAVQYTKTGDVDAAYRLVASNLRLVVKIAYEYRRAAFNVLDLIQEGNVGLMHAVKKYDPSKGVKLSSYSAWWIRAYILRFIMDNWRMVKLGTTQAQRKLFFNLRKEQQKLAAEGYEAGPKLLADRLQVTEREVEEMDRRLSGDEMSIDTPISEEGGGGTYGDRIPERAAGADEALGQAELRELLRRELVSFGAEITDPREKMIFENRMLADEPQTLQEIGERFGVSRERARQIEAGLVARLRERLKARMPDFAELTFHRED